MRQPTSPFIEGSDAIILADLINDVAEAFDPSTLTRQQALALYLLLDRAMSALWNAHGDMLLHFYQLSMRLAADEPSEDDVQ